MSTWEIIHIGLTFLPAFILGLWALVTAMYAQEQDDRFKFVGSILLLIVALAIAALRGADVAMEWAAHLMQAASHRSAV